MSFDSRGHELVELVQHVRTIGLETKASALLLAALKPAPKPMDDETKPLGWHRQQTDLGLEYWNVSQLVKKTVEAGGTSTGLDVLSALIRAAEAYLLSEYRGSTYRDSTWISSEGWDGDDHGYEDPLRIILRGCYREATRLLTAGVPRAKVMTKVAESKWSAFQRLRMKLLSQDPGPNLAEIRTTILDHSTYDDSSVRRDYALLLEASRTLLSDHDKQVYCALVEADINAETVRASVAAVFPGREVSEAEIGAIVQRERASRLAPLAGSLPEPWAAAYNEAVAKYGRPRFVYGPAEIGEGGFAIGAADLSGQTPEQILERIGQYDLDHKAARFDPLAHDLYRGLELAVAGRPADLAIPDFCQQVPPGFHGAYLDGLHAAVTQGSLKAATAVSLGKKLADRGTTETGRHELTRLLEEVFKSEECPPETLELTIHLLEHLATTGEVPTDVDVWSATETALNRPRTRAFQVLLQCLAKTGGEKPRHAEFGGPLSAAIARVVQAWPAPSPILAAVLGEAFVNLWVSNRALLLQTAGRHFMASSAEDRHFAWVAYVTWNRAYGETVRPLMAAYEEGMEWTYSQPPNVSERHGSNYMEGLARHLTAMWYRGWGTDLLRDLIMNAPSDVADFILREFSMGLDATTPGESADMVARIGNLIDHFVARASSGELKMERLQALGRICETEGHFPPASRMKWLSQLAGMQGYLHLDSDLIGAVLRCQSDAAEETSLALAALLPKAHFYAIKENLEGLQSALADFASTGTEAQKARLATSCDQLVQQGFGQFEAAFYALQPVPEVPPTSGAV